MKIRDCGICIFLFLFSLILRIILVSKGPFSAESLNLVMKAEQTVDTFQLQYLFGSGYPLTMLITAVSIFVGRLVGVTDPVLSANYMSAIGGALSVLMFYILVKRLFDKHTALLSAIMLSLSPIFLSVTVYAKSHAYELIFAFGALIALLKFCDTHKFKDLFVSSILFGCMGAVRIQDLVFIIPSAAFIVMFMYTEGDQRKLSFSLACKNIFVLTGIAFVIVLLFHLPYVLGSQRAEYIQQFQNFRQLSFSDFYQQSLLLSFPYYSKWFVLNFSIGGLVAGCVGIALALKKSTLKAVLGLIWLFVPLGFYCVIDTTIPRLFVILLPPFTIYICYFINECFIRHSRYVQVLGVLFFTFIVSIMFGNIHPILNRRHHEALLVDYVKWARSKMPSNSVIIAKDDFIFFRHYGNLETLSRPNPVGSDYYQKLARYRDDIIERLAQGQQIYINGVGLYSYDPKRLFESYMSQYFMLEEVGRHWYEGYHAGELNPVVFQDPLFKIVSK